MKNISIRKHLIVSFGTLLLCFGLSSAWAQSVPNVITFQSILFDDTGTAITDDATDLLFRIVDDAGTVLYSEEQKGVAVFDGMVNVLIGTGIVPGSDPATPTGGLTLADLNPAQPLFLEVTVGTTTTLELLELTSVPYAFYAGEALSVAPNSITSEHIVDGSITNIDMGTINFTDIGGTLDVTQLPAAAATDSEVSAVAATLQTQIDGKLSIDGSISMTGDLNMGGNDVSNVGLVDGVDVDTHNHSGAGQGGTISYTDLTNRPTIATTRPSSSITVSNTNTTPCTRRNGDWYCSVSVSCSADEVMTGCTGLYDNACWGSATCDYLGAEPTGPRTCRAEIAQDLGANTTLTVYAICLSMVGL